MTLIEPPKTHQEELDILQSLGFPTNPFNSSVSSLEQIWEKVQELDTERSSLPYPIDGLVIKLNDNQITADLGVVGKTPRTWSAVKFAAEEVSTRLLGISWSVGRTGKVTPVADLEAVQLAGTTVQRASLHNYKEVLDQDLHKFDTVIVRKAGDIIPEVIQVLSNLRHSEAEKLTPPTLCPSCESKLDFTSTGIDLICRNTTNCKTQIVKRMAYFCQRNLGNITGLSEKQIEKFVTEFGISDVADLYDLPWNKIEVLEGFGEKSVQNLKDSIEKSKNIVDYKFLAGLGIDGIGVEVAKLVVGRMKAQEEIREKTI
jgi:DNA ligase (NAD+)